MGKQQHIQNDGRNMRSFSLRNSERIYEFNMNIKKDTHTHTKIKKILNKEKHISKSIIKETNKEKNYYHYYIIYINV